MTFQNSGTYKHSGIEATLRFSQGPWSLSPSYTHLNQNSYNESVPTDKFVLDGACDGKRLRVGFEMISALNTRSDSSGVPVVLEDYSVVNIENTYHITPDVDFSLRISNLFDENYQIVAGYPMPGITFRGGMAVRMF